jgi:hypothetical protein
MVGQDTIIHYSLRTETEYGKRISNYWKTYIILRLTNSIWRARRVEIHSILLIELKQQYYLKGKALLPIATSIDTINDYCCSNTLMHMKISSNTVNGILKITNKY